MFPKIDALPGSEGTTAIPNRQIQVRLRQDASNMGWHVVGTFRGMTEHRVAIRNLPGHERLEVSHHAGVGIFAKYQRRAGVTDKDVTKPGLDPGIANKSLHIGAEIVGASAFRRDLEFVLRNQGMKGSP